MKQSTYKMILVSDASRDATDYLQHYGVKGMKWGVVHDEDEKRRTQSVRNSMSQTSNSAIEKATKIIDDLPPESRQKLESATKSFLKTKDGKQLQKKITKIVENSSGEINDKTVKEIMGVATNAVQSEELMEGATELMDTVKDVALDELEKENPTLGKAAKAVDSFIDSVNDFVDDLMQSVNKIIGDIMSWGKKLFGG